MDDEANIVNLKGIDLDTVIYRYITFDVLLCVLKYKKLLIKKPRTWEDKFENIIIELYEKLYLDKILNRNYRDCIFAQCWSFDENNKKLWEGNNSIPNDIRISTTIRNLKYELNRDNYHTCRRSCFIGKIVYKTCDEILNDVENYTKYFKNNPDDTTKIAESSLFKRKEYEFENEIRLLYIDLISYNKDSQELPSSPETYIKKIKINPNYESNKYQNIKSIISELWPYELK